MAIFKIDKVIIYKGTQYYKTEMATCAFCSADATHQESTVPYHAFCGKPCQEIHYALIAAGGKRKREEKKDPQQPVPGFDFTDTVDNDVLALLMQRFTFADMFNLSHLNTRLRDMCNDPQFQRMYLLDPKGRLMFRNFIFDLPRMNEINIRNLPTWIRTARELVEKLQSEKLIAIADELKGILESEKLIAIAIRHNYLPLVIQEVERIGFKDETKVALLKAAMQSGRLSIFRFLRNRFPDPELQLENAIWSGNMEMLQYLYTIPNVNYNVSPDLVAVIHQERIFQVASFLMEKNTSKWTVYLLDRIMQRDDSDFVEAFFRNMKIPKFCIYWMIKNKTHFHLRNVVVVIKILEDEIRSSVITEMVLKAWISIPMDEEYFRWIMKNPKLSSDDKILIFEHLMNRFNAYDRIIEWMVHNRHVDPSYDDNVTYMRFEYAREFLSRFPQVRAKLLRETLPPL